MSVIIEARPLYSTTGEARAAAARTVLAVFPGLPTTPRLLCFFDDEDWPLFKDEGFGLGKANRGLSAAVKKCSTWPWRDWPPHVVEKFYAAYPSDDREPKFDFVTYLHNSSCEIPVGLTMTYTHELQHFVQYTNMQGVWKANERFKNWSRDFETGLFSHDLPIEQEARIVAKRIAIQIHGPVAVSRYIEDNIADPVDELDFKNWEFVNGLDVSKPYDLKLQTKLLDEQLHSRNLKLKRD